MISPLCCMCFVRLICNVNLAHDFTRRYQHYGSHTLIILRDKIGTVQSAHLFQQWLDALQSLAKYHLDTSHYFDHSKRGSNLGVEFNFHKHTFKRWS